MPDLKSRRAAHTFQAHSDKGVLGILPVWFPSADAPAGGGAAAADAASAGSAGSAGVGAGANVASASGAGSDNSLATNGFLIPATEDAAAAEVLCTAEQPHSLGGESGSSDGSGSGGNGDGGGGVDGGGGGGGCGGPSLLTQGRDGELALWANIWKEGRGGGGGGCGCSGLPRTTATEPP